MNRFTKRSVGLALVAASLISGPEAGAVFLSTTGTGQVLIYPYYTVRTDSHGNGFVTALDVVNATAAVKAVKVRFLEGKAGQDVLDFNLYLSPNDVWTAALTSSATGTTLVTFDNSCTVPPIPKPGGTPFTNAAYVLDPAGGSLDRTREGWFEIIEMGPVTNVTVANAATHNSAGMPANCSLVANDNGGGVAAPTGGLFGGETLINVAAGTDYTADPVALEAWRNAPLWTPPGNPHPDLEDALPQRTTVHTMSSGQELVIVTGGQSWGGTNSADPVSAVLMHDTVYNEFVLDPTTQSGTDWVITYPTKPFYYVPVSPSVWQVTALFQRNFTATGACDDIGTDSDGQFPVFDREEKGPNPLSPGQPPKTGPICWAANVLTFNNSDVLGSVDVLDVSTSNWDGWIIVSFPTAFSVNTDIASNHQLASSAATTSAYAPATGIATTFGSATYFGLPVIGFSVNSYLTGVLQVKGQTVLSAYGGNFIHKYSDSIKTP